MVIDNKGTIEVDFVNVFLEQYVTTTVVSVGKRDVNTKIFPLNITKYREKYGFPRGTGYYKTHLTYFIKKEVQPTDCDNSACYAVEYKLAIELNVPYHQPVKLLFPIRLFSTEEK